MYHSICKHLTVQFYSFTKSNFKNINYFSQVNNNPQIITTKANQTVIDFPLLETEQAQIDCMLILNNVLNLQWIGKTLNNCENIVMADGGANQLYESGFRDTSKVRGIIGDLDSLRDDVAEYYVNKGAIVKKIEDQNQNDFEKAATWCIQNGWKHIFCFGAFGGRMDHTLATMHNAEKITHKYPQMEIILFGKTNLMCHLQCGTKYRIILSDDMNRSGCGIICFNQATNVQTTGFKWNLGPKEAFSTLKWSDFISTSNEMVQDQITITNLQSKSHLNFVANFIH